MTGIHWFEYGVREVRSRAPGPPDDARYLGCSRGARSLGLDDHMFAPHGEEVGLGFREPHWHDWPRGFRGGLLLRAVHGQDRNLRFVLGHVAEALTNDGRQTSRGLWYVLPEEWLTGPRKLPPEHLAAVVEELSRRMIASRSGGHCAAGNAPVTFDASGVIPVALTPEPWLRGMRKRAAEGLRFRGAPDTDLLDPPSVLAAMIGAARDGAQDDARFRELAEAGVAVLGESIEGTEFGWLVPYDTGLPIAPPPETRVSRDRVPAPLLLPAASTRRDPPIESWAELDTLRRLDRRLTRAYAWAVIATLAAVLLAVWLVLERRGARSDPRSTVSTTPRTDLDVPAPVSTGRLPVSIQPPSADARQAPSGAAAPPLPAAAPYSSGAASARWRSVHPPATTTPRAAGSATASTTAAAPTGSVDVPAPPMTAKVTTSSASITAVSPPPPTAPPAASAAPQPSPASPASSSSPSTPGAGPQVPAPRP